MTLLETVTTTMAAWRRGSWPGPVLSSKAPLIVAVSGGADSLALLHLFSQQKLHNSKALIVAHLNHKLRPEANDDAAFVATIAKQWGLTFRLKEVDVRALAVAEKRSEEDAGRVARYRFFAELCREYDAQFVAVGHQADDQAETVLQHLLRGAGPAGLAAIPPLARLPEGGGQFFVIRPLLACTTTEVRQYCQDQGLSPRIDLTNIDPKYQRNKIRHELLPLLTQYNPQISERLTSLARLAAEDEELISNLAAERWQSLLIEQGEGWLRIHRPGWRQEAIALQRRILRTAVIELRGQSQDISFRTIESARQIADLGGVGAEVSLPAAITLQIESEALLFFLPEKRPKSSLPQLDQTAELQLQLPFTVSLSDGWTLQARIVTNPGLAKIKANRNTYQAFLSLSEGDTVEIRSRRVGDEFLLTPTGRQSLKKYMSQRGLPAEARRQWPLILIGGQVVWIPGYEVGRNFQVQAGDKQVVQLSCERGDVR